MAEFPVRIPKTSLAATEATLLEHLIGEGDAVEEGQALYLIETEKVEQEIEAPATGLIHWSASVSTGETYEVGTQIGYIDTGG